MSAPRNRILVGDALDRVRQLPDDSVDCVVTSPPYFRLRDYGHADQLGLEAHVDRWVDQLQQLMSELRRVLVPTGTIWLNLGDSYSVKPAEGAARKSLLLGPERLALRLLDDGWLVRNKIVWAKTNTVPTSVSDRLATKHEFIYVLARSPRYFFDLDAVREPHVSRPPKRKTPTRPASRKPNRPAWLGPNSDGDRGLVTLHAAGLVGHPLGKNPGDVWQLAVSSYRGPHFATFPIRLAERMIRAGCPERRCSRCRAAYRRPVRRLGAVATRLALRAPCQCDAASEPGLVLDPFLGSGTTAIAAESLGRDWLGIDINPDYVALAADRIDGERATGQRKEVIHE